MKKSWHLDRRTFLRGSGVALALPWMESMSSAASLTELPRRLCCLYVPFGVSLPPANHEHADWNWFPRGRGKEFEFTNTLKPLEPFRKQLTVLGGLSHPAGRKMGGHDTGDIFLTGAEFKGSSYLNSISLDQYVAEHIATQTRFPSLTLSSDGGVGEPTRATTLSFSREGRPIPALANPKQIFARLFGDDGESMQAKRRELQNSGSMLDLLLEHSKTVRGKLGKQDQAKLDEYMSSVRQIEQRVDQSQKWLEIPKPDVDPNSVQLEASPEGPLAYLKSMYDLMFLAFQTDTTRVATYMIGQVAGATTVANTFPSCIGLNGNWHGLAHGANKKGGFEQLGKFDQFLVQQVAYFINRLQETREGDGNLLDRTLVFYGSSNSRTHQNRNYPLLLAGGNQLGLKHGQFLEFSEQVPLSNLFLTMLQRLQVPAERFADSTGELTEIVA